MTHENQRAAIAGENLRRKQTARQRNSAAAIT